MDKQDALRTVGDGIMMMDGVRRVMDGDGYGGDW